ncbi:MAG: ROK family protein [Alphaproteobacteria bacterium]|nr:ROK family protein [Alphaproteobacteria bacterium]
MIQSLPLAPALVADIGGTNTRVALADGDKVRAESIRRYANAGFANLEAVLTRYLAESSAPKVSGVCVAVAGPVRDGVASMTNLDWTITGAGLTAATEAAKTAILNDLQAQGHALGRIAPQHLREVIAGPSKPGAAMLVVGLGTGMNAAPVHETPWGRVVAASECGHISMPVRTDEDHRLSRFVAEVGPHAHGFAGVEDVLAGRGLERIYAFAAREAGQDRTKSGAEIMADVAAGDPVARHAAGLYIHLLGQELGNLALIHLPFGGIYLIGGVARAMQPHFDAMNLTAHFRDKGRFAEFMASFSVRIVEDDYAALTGCAAYLSGGGQG